MIYAHFVLRFTLDVFEIVGDPQYKRQSDSDILIQSKLIVSEQTCLANLLIQNNERITQTFMVYILFIHVQPSVKQID